MKKRPTHSPEADKLRRNPRPLLRAALIIAAYLCAFIILDLFSRQFEELKGVVAWYPPAGLTYTLLLVFGVRFAPAVTIALFISSLFIYRMPQPTYLLFLWALIISLIYSGATAFLRGRIRFDWQLRKLRDVTWLVVTAIFVSALLAVLSVSSSALSSDMPRSEVLLAIFHWWIGETVGVLTVSPFLLIYVMPWLKRFAEGQPIRLFARRSFPRLTLSVIGQASSLALTLYWVFGARVLAEFQPLYLITLPLIWIALQRGFKGVSVGIVASNFGVVLALWFFRFDLARLSELELLMIVNCVVGLFMGAVVTERKQGEAALRESEEHLRLVTDNMEDMVIRTDLEGLILYASPSHKTVLGYEPEYLVGRSIYDFMHPEDIDQVREFTLAALQAQTHGKQEFRYRHADGHYLWLESAGAIIFDKGGSPAGAVFSSREITERKQAEEMLLESELRFRTIFDRTIDGILIADMEAHRFFMGNNSISQMLGYTQDELSSLGVDDIHPFEQLPYVLEQFNRQARGEINLAEDIPVRRKDGSVFYADINSTTIALSEKIYVMGVFHDITERKQAEESLRQSEERFSKAFHASPVAISITTLADARFLEVNDSFLKLIGQPSRAEIIGRSVLELSVGVSSEYRAALAQAMQEHGRVSNIEAQFDTLAGEKRDVLASLELVELNGETCILTLAYDITERKRAEEDIRSRTDELTTLYSLSRLLADANDLEGVIELVIRHAAESVRTTFACIALVEDGELVRRAVYPVRGMDHDFKLGDRQPFVALPGCQRILEQNEPVILQAGSPEVSRLERATFLLDFAQSVCLVPLRIGDSSQNSSQVLGLLILGEARGKGREPFTTEKVHLARSIGDQAAAAIRRLLLREHAGRRLQRLASLSEIDRNIASNFDLRLSLQMILNHVIEQLEVDAADVLVFNASLQILEFTAGRGFRSPANERSQQRLGEGQAGQAALERRIIQIPDVVASGAVFAQPELLKGEDIAAYFAVPLITKGQVKGVMEIFQRTPLEPNLEWLDFLNSLAGQAAIAIDNVQLFNNLQRSNTELALAYDATIEGWSRALDLRDKETEGHTQRVVEMMLELSREAGMNETDLVHIRRGTLLHDIGKMGVLDGILLKPGPLTDEEWVVMKRHPALAYEMLSPIRYLHAALDIPYCHHEKWDGSGYPRGLKGEQIPFAARLFAVVDVWDALRSDRPYREAWPEEKVLEHIQAGSGTHFDPKAVELFIQVEKAHEYKQGVG